MNAVICHQLFMMLKVSHFSGRYIAPSISHVAKQTLAVYAYAAALASAGTWNVWGIPYKGGIYQGYACLVKDYDDASTIFFWLGFLPLCVFIPMAYVISCIVRVYRGRMLPPRGQRSTLYMYFSLIFVFAGMWLPFIIITFAWGPARPGVDSTWVLWIGAQFSHLQGLATVWTILFKLDIRAAFMGTISCGKWKLEPRPSQGNTSGSGSRGSRTLRTEQRISGSMQIQSAVSQPSRASSVGSLENRVDNRPVGLDSINEVLGDVSQSEPRDSRDPKEGDKDNVAEKEMGLPASAKRLGSSSDGSAQDGEIADGFRDIQVQQYASYADEEMGIVNPASSSSSRRDSRSSFSSRSSGRPSIAPSLDSFTERDLGIIADGHPTEIQRVVFEESVTLGVEGDEDVNQISSDEESVTFTNEFKLKRSHGRSSDSYEETDVKVVVNNCLPSEMQKRTYEDAVTLGIDRKGIVFDERASCANSVGSSRENGSGVIPDGPPSSIHLKKHEDSGAFYGGNGRILSSHDSDDDKSGSLSDSFDDTFLKIIANISSVPTPSQQMLFEDAAVLQIDCSELIQNEDSYNSFVI